MKSLVTPILNFISRLRHGVTLSTGHYKRLVAAVNERGPELSSLTDTELQNQFAGLRNTVTDDQPNHNMAVDLFAVAREAAERTVSMRPYDVQLLAAFAMNDGQCVEMQTGEGKTLAAALVVCLRALSGKGVHVLTFNSYLAERDAQWMGPLYRFLGLSTGYVAEGMTTEQRQAAYACDITYVTAKEAGFDFLRDQLCDNPNRRVQRGHHLAIIDEADSILIDEARIPLVIATEAEKDDTNLYEIAELVRPLRNGLDFEIKVSGRNISFTETGLNRLEQRLGIPELHSAAHADTLARLNLALQAEFLLSRDVDYIVRDDAIELIDEFTGRVADNRKWPGGLQAALEAKESVTIQPQGRILNSITLQHFLELYRHLAGMTGTAVEATEELANFYRLKVTIIDPNRPCIRTDHPDRIFAGKREKTDALIEEIATQNAAGRPVLIGTASVGESETLAQRLEDAGISCRVLNAANDHLEADIIAEAGASGAVTISTNMAGRGTDICLGGSDQKDRARVVELGGLYVIGTNRHESRRIDNQLRGRSGRQGDPGESRFFVSLEDDLIARHDLAAIVVARQEDSDGAIDHERTAKHIAHLQRVIEGECYEIRGTLRVYSKLLEVQRRIISKNRDDLLTGAKPPSALRKRAPELRERLVEQWGEELINDAERKVTLVHLDWLWSDHLAHAAEIREGIHLVSFGGFNPYDVFNRELGMEFEAFLTQVEEKVVATMSTATITSDGINLEAEGLTGPSSTWTFTVGDNPRGAVFSRILRSVVSRLKNMLQ